MTIKEYLLNLGHREYKVNKVLFQHADAFFQKSVRDDSGIKYFIDFVYYAPIEGKTGESWMCEVTINNPHQTYEQHYIKSIEEVNRAIEKCELFFNTMGCEYYEKYEIPT